MKDVSIWVAGDELTDYERTVAGLLKMRVSVADLFVTRAPQRNAQGKYARQPVDWRDRDNIVRCARAVRRAGMRVRLSVWLQPHERTIDDLATVLDPLMMDTGAESLTLDAEGPWNNPTADAQSFGAAAEQVEAALGHHTLIMSAIGWVDPDNLDALSLVCPWHGPQAYQHEGEGNSGIDPATVVSDSIARWKARLPGDGPALGYLPGLAAWKQANDPWPNMSATIADARRNNIEEVSYWSAGPAMSRRASVTSVIAGVRRSSGPPRLDVGAMSSLVRSDHVESLQVRLDQYGTDPGPIDGLPGVLTLAALRGWQSLRGLRDDGIVWPSQWAELIGE